MTGRSARIERASGGAPGPRSLGPLATWTVALAPVVLVSLYGTLLAVPTLRIVAHWLRGEFLVRRLVLVVERFGIRGIFRFESGLIELLTFIAFFAGGIVALRIVWRLRDRPGRPGVAFYFYLVFGLGLLFVAMEEVAWGQHFLGFETPAALERVSGSGEFTLHNIGSLHGRTEVFRLVYGLAGLAGVGLHLSGRLREIAAPPVLLTWFVIITAHAVPDFYLDVVGHRTGLQGEGTGEWFVNIFAEYVEMLIAGSALLFAWLNSRRLRRP